MLRLALLALLPLAPAPFEEPDPEPDPQPAKAVDALSKAYADPKADADALQKRQKALVDKLFRRAAELEKKGKKAEADAANDCAVLAESLGTDKHLEKA